MSERERERKAAERERRDQHLSDIEDSLKTASVLIDKSRREVKRSQRLIRESDARQDAADAKIEDDAPRS